MLIVYTLILIISFNTIITTAFQSLSHGFGGHSRLPHRTTRSNFNFDIHVIKEVAAEEHPSTYTQVSVGSQRYHMKPINSSKSKSNFSKRNPASPHPYSSDSSAPFTADAIYTEHDRNEGILKRRRLILHSLTIFPLILSGSECMAVQRAVGSAEQACREAGNCLEKLELDGFIGWNWGGKDRCDPNDSRCGVDGNLRSSATTAKAVPRTMSDEGLRLKITDIINMRLSIGKKETGTLRIGLYGEQCPKAVQQLLSFCGDVGLVTSDRLMSENGFDLVTAPLRLGSGGVLSMIYPEKRIEFGILQQSKAYAKAKRLSRAGDNFVAQPRPPSDEIAKEKSARSHKVAGLITIPKNGIGHGGSLFDSDDDAFTESFGIIAAGDESLDSGRKVIGQLIDEESMAVLSRLSSLATVKGLKGFVPGLSDGPPLLPVVINELSIQANDSS